MRVKAQSVVRWQNKIISPSESGLTDGLRHACAWSFESGSVTRLMLYFQIMAPVSVGLGAMGCYRVYL